MKGMFAWIFSIILLVSSIAAVSGQEDNYQQAQHVFTCSTPEECEQLRQQLDQETQYAQPYGSYESNTQDGREADDDMSVSAWPDSVEEDARMAYCREHPDECATLYQPRQAPSPQGPAQPSPPQGIQSMPSCSTPEECMTWCRANPDRCRMEGASPQPGGWMQQRDGQYLLGYPEMTTSTPPPCSSPQECMRWCKENKDACTAMKERSGMVGRERMMQTIPPEQIFSSEPVTIMTTRTVVYETYGEMDPQEMVMYKLFENLGRDADTSTFMQHCPDAEKVADAAMTMMKGRGAFDLQQACSGIRKQVEQCRDESSRGCDFPKMDCATMDRPGMVVMCEEMLVKQPEMMQSLEGKSCTEMVEAHYEEFKGQCERQDAYREQCREASAKACGRMEEALERCGSITEDQLRSRVLEHSRRMCGMMQYAPTAGLVQVRGQLPEEHKVVLDTKAGEMLDAEKKAEELEKAEKERGLSYKLKWLLGQTKETEESEATQLDEQAGKLDDAIQALTAVMADLESEQAKAAIAAQITFLEQRRDELEQMAEKKRNRAGGLTALLKDIFS